MNLQLLASLGWHELPILIFAGIIGLVFCLVSRPSQKDYVELVGILTRGKADS